MEISLSRGTGQENFLTFPFFCWTNLCNKIQLDAPFILSPIPTRPTDSQLEKHNTYQLLYIYSIPPDDGLQICPKHVQVDRRNKLRINSVSSWFLLHRFDSNVTQQYGGREKIFFSCQLMTITNKPLEQHVTTETGTDPLITI